MRDDRVLTANASFRLNSVMQDFPPTLTQVHALAHHSSSHSAPPSSNASRFIASEREVREEGRRGTTRPSKATDSVGGRESATGKLGYL